MLFCVCVWRLKLKKEMVDEEAVSDLDRFDESGTNTRATNAMKFK